jgi:Holliday junction resolvase
MNSKSKGKRGELDAVRFLKESGFPDARRNQQFCGANGDSDVVCPNWLPNVHIECKRDEDMDIGKANWHRAINQAQEDCGEKEWCVLWRRNRDSWKLTYQDVHRIVTVDEASIGDSLRWLNQGEL